ncbi:hypothetical protein KP509_37G002400 [Ceratopteris richardii]|uniref:NADH dehydrogenase subunit 4 n=1 Tax=Ceratopteris richardii TaxID=49495 RepID=A0A8T2Q5Q5_CERRI|nr:hypothetical protein KP509_37G002400 [Ceratopteris richardii]
MHPQTSSSILLVLRLCQLCIPHGHHFSSAPTFAIVNFMFCCHHHHHLLCAMTHHIPSMPSASPILMICWSFLMVAINQHRGRSTSIANAMLQYTHLSLIHFLPLPICMLVCVYSLID